MERQDDSDQRITAMWETTRCQDAFPSDNWAKEAVEKRHQVCDHSSQRGRDWLGWQYYKLCLSICN